MCGCVDKFGARDGVSKARLQPQVDSANMWGVRGKRKSVSTS